MKQTNIITKQGNKINAKYFLELKQTKEIKKENKTTVTTETNFIMKKVTRELTENKNKITQQ